MEILHIILASIASEITFLISFLLIYQIAILIRFLYAILNIKNKYRWMSDGLLCGIGSIFLCCYVTFFISKKLNLSELEIILIAIAFPIIGEIGYWKFLAKNSKTFFVARLHQVMKVFPQRGQFASNFSYLNEQIVLNMSDDDLMNINKKNLQNTEKMEELRQEAYEMTQGYLAYLLLWSFVGYILGLFLVHYFIF